MAMSRSAGSIIVDDPVADLDGALGDRLEARDHAQQRGLAAAGRADQHDEFAVGDVDGDGFHRLDAACVDLRNIGDVDRCHGRVSSTCRFR